jgi:hypothetical protein
VKQAINAARIHCRRLDGRGIREDSSLVTAEQIKKAQERAPFRPYLLHLSDQRSMRIEHPDYLWIIPGGRNIAIADDSGAVEIVDLIHVTSLHIGTNGKPRKRKA